MAPPTGLAESRGGECATKDGADCSREAEGGEGREARANDPPRLISTAAAPHPGPAPRGGAVNRRPVHRCGPGLPCSGRPVCTAASTASAQSLAPKEALLPSRRRRRRPGARISRPCPSAVALTRAPDALSSTLTFSRVALGRSPERRLRTFRAQPAMG